MCQGINMNRCFLSYGPSGGFFYHMLPMFDDIDKLAAFCVGVGSHEKKTVKWFNNNLAVCSEKFFFSHDC